MQGKVLFVVDEENVATRYRCDHQVEQLGLCGIEADVVHTQDVDDLDLEKYGSAVLVRVEWSQRVASLVGRLRARARPVVFDTDDLLFEPELTRYLAFARTWPEDDRRRLEARRERYRQTLAACDRATVSTEPLAEHARHYVTEAAITYNAVSGAMVERADRVLASLSTRIRRRRRRVTIGYFSGTRTHDRDFLEAADAVLWALATYRFVHLFVVGKLELDERFAGWSTRVTRLPLQAWPALPSLIARTDINLAPLEPANPITECKSCVKYLEAGLLGVPTIASPRPDFVRVIEHGANGMLADTQEEWTSALERLVESRSARNAIGEAAREDVRANHTTTALAHSLRSSLLDATRAAAVRPQRSH